MFVNNKCKSCICAYIPSQTHLFSPSTFLASRLPPLLLFLSLSAPRLKALRFSGR